MTEQTRGFTYYSIVRQSFEMSYNSMYNNLQGHISPQLLLKHGGKDLLMLKRHTGGSCLVWPAQKGHSEVVRVLEEACKEYGLSGSDIDALKKR